MVILFPSCLSVLHFSIWGIIISWKWAKVCCTRIKYSQDLVLHSCPVQSATQNTLSGPILLLQWKVLSLHLPHIIRDREAKNLLFPTCNFLIFLQNTYTYMKMYVSAGIYMSKNKTRRNATLPSHFKRRMRKMWVTSPKPRIFDAYQEEIRHQQSLLKYSSQMNFLKWNWPWICL